MSEQKVKALVVDDEIAACVPLEKFLTRQGYDVRAVFNGHDALQTAQEFHPDVALLDIRMPGIDGIETLRRLRQMNLDCVVIMLTAVDDVETALSALREGASEFLQKPVMLAELLHHIDSALEKRRLLRENEAYQRDLELKVREQTREISGMLDLLKVANIEIVRALSEAIEARDAYTRGHCGRVAALSLALGREAGLYPRQLETLEYGALLHDVGKIGVPNEVLLKEGELTGEEFEIIKRHTVIGDRILSNISFLDGSREIVRHHHERYDGGGYPDALPRERQTVSSQIVLIADAFDAMTSDRPYRGRLTRKQALETMENEAGTNFNPRLVELFLSRKLYDLEI